MSASQHAQALFANAVKALVRRPHTEAELRQKLMRACLRRTRMYAQQQTAIDEATRSTAVSADSSRTLGCTDTVAAVLENLRNQHLLDDAHAAQWHVEQRNTYRPRSHLELRSELSRKGVKADTTATIIAETAQSNLAAAAKLATRRSRDDDAKLLQYLARKGFPAHTVRAVVDARRRGGPEALQGIIMTSARDGAGHGDEEQ